MAGRGPGRPRRVAVGDLSLDIPETQVAVWYEDDPHLNWHVRILFRRIETSRWVVGTPTLSVQVIDLSEYDVVPLGRAAPFP